MNAIIKRGLYLSGVWLFPIVLVLAEATLFLSRANWQSEYIYYFVTFWALRALLTPGIVYYTLRFWTDLHQWFQVFLTHLVGFLIFSSLFWTLAYLLLHKKLFKSEFFSLERTTTDIGIFGLIVDNSISTNLIVYVSSVVCCYLWSYLQQNFIIHKKAHELEKSLLISRLEVLKGQLNTHFLFNTLHTISSLVVRHQNDEANQMLLRLSELLRFALKENKEQFIPMHKEIQLLQIYLDIQKTRFKERLDYCVHVHPDIKHSLVPSLLLQPLVENAVKYGVEPFMDKGLVTIDIAGTAEKIGIYISDSGQTPFSDIKFNPSIGLANTRERLHQLYHDEYKFLMHPSHNGMGVKVYIEIPNKRK